MNHLDLIKDTINELKNSNKNIVIIGAGRGGWYTAKVFEHFKIKIDCFADSNESKHGAYLNYNVFSFEKTLLKFPDSVFLLSLLETNHVQAITKNLKELGAKDVRYIMPSILCSYMLEISKRACNSKNYMKNIDLNYLKDEEKKLYCFSPTLSYVLTEKCTLNCKECGAFVPEILDPETYEVERIIDDIKKYCSAFDIVHHIALQGGEPFLHKGISKIVEEISKIDNLLFIDIVSNATFIPKINTLKKISDYGVTIVMSDYGKFSPKINELTDVCGNLGIFVDYHKYTDRLWGAQHPIHKRSRSVKENLKTYNDCISDKYLCCQLMDGQLHRCSFSNFTNKLKYIPDYTDDYVKLSDFKVNDKKLKEKIREVALHKKFLNACDYCPGNERESIPAGLQLPREKKNKSKKVIENKDVIHTA